MKKKFRTLISQLLKDSQLDGFITIPISMVLIMVKKNRVLCNNESVKQNNIFFTITKVNFTLDALQTTHWLVCLL